MKKFTHAQMHRSLFEEPAADLERADPSEGLLGFMIGGMANLSYRQLGEQYFKAARVLSDAIGSGDQEDHKLANPVLFLYRHAIELFLKVALKDAEKTHYIGILADQLRTKMKLDLATDMPDWIYNRLNELAKTDPNSTAFRYSENYNKASKRRSLVDGEFHVDLAHLQNAMSALGAALIDIIDSLTRVRTLVAVVDGGRPANAAPSFKRYIGIDYSGAETPSASLKGLRVYMAEDDIEPQEVLPPPSNRKYWSRRGIAEWLVARLGEGVPTLVGIDHGFSFPLWYFEVHGLATDWPLFLDDFQRHWPTDDDIYVDFVRDGKVGNGAARQGNTRWRRLTEERAGGAKSVFHFDVQGSVAKSTHSGIPWLRFIRKQLGPKVHFWPFDGWEIPVGRSAIAEVYPALWSRGFSTDGRTPDQHDAFSIAAFLSHADHGNSLSALLMPDLTPAELTIAEVEGWILGVQGRAQTGRAPFEFKINF